MYGGERSSSSARNDGAEPDEDDDECEPIADVCTLDALAHFWVTLPMDGAHPLQALYSMHARLLITVCRSMTAMRHKTCFYLRCFRGCSRVCL